MEYKDDTSLITLRKCDLNSILMMLSLNNKEAVKASWETFKLFESENQKEGE